MRCRRAPSSLCTLEGNIGCSILDELRELKAIIRREQRNKRAGARRRAEPLMENSRTE